MDEEYIPRKSALQAIYTSTAPALEVKAIPAADVVEVVRCRECIFGNMPCAMARYPDYFCADGKRKDGGQNDAEIH